MIIFSLIAGIITTVIYVAIVAIVSPPRAFDRFFDWSIVIVFFAAVILADRKVSQYEFCESAVLNICAAGKTEYRR